MEAKVKIQPLQCDKNTCIKGMKHFQIYNRKNQNFLHEITFGCLNYMEGKKCEKCKAEGHSVTQCDWVLEPLI